MLRKSDLLLLKRLVRFWQKKLGLCQWTGSVGWDTGGALAKDTEAEIEWDPHSLTFRILFSPSLDFTNLNVTIVHELLHLIDWSAEDSLQEHWKDCRGFAYKEWQRAHDVAVTHIARAFVAQAGGGPVEVLVKLEAELARRDKKQAKERGR